MLPCNLMFKKKFLIAYMYVEKHLIVYKEKI